MLILAAILAIFTYGTIAAMLGTILPDLSRKFRLTPAQNGTIALFQAIGLTLAALFAGPLIDAEGKKVGLAIGLGLVAVALFLLPRATGYSSILLLIFAVGLGGGTIVTGAFSLVPDVSASVGYPGGTVANLLNTFFGLGGLLTPLIAANIMKGDSVKLCLSIAVVSVGAFLVCLLAPIAPPTQTGAALFSGAGGLFGQIKFWGPCALLFLYVSSEVGVWNWLAQHLIAQGIPESKALNILSLGFALGLLVGRLVVSPILISVSPLTVIIGAAAFMAITTYAMLQVKSGTTAGAIVFLAGLAMAPVFPTTLALVQSPEYFPNNATALGIVQAFGWLGIVVSSRVIGSIAGSDPKRIKTALLVLPAASALMVLIGLALPK